MNFEVLLIFLALSGSLAFVFAYFIIRLSKYFLNSRYIYFGMSVFFIGIALHSALAFPVLLAGHGFGIIFKNFTGAGFKFGRGELLYFATAAGIGQEIAKALPFYFELKRTKGKEPSPPFLGLGLNLGLGFSLSEIIFLAFTGWEPNATNFAFSTILLGSWERLSATLFHMSTAGLIAYGIEKRKTALFLVIAILLHFILDSFAGLTANHPVFSIFVEETLLFLFSLSLLIVSILLLKEK